jgi:hypothetical protein
MKTITISKAGNHYIANVYGIRGQQSREHESLIFNSDFLQVNEIPDYSNGREEVCVIAGVNWTDNTNYIGELIKIAVDNSVSGYTTRKRLLNNKFGGLLPPLDMI